MKKIIYRLLIIAILPSCASRHYLVIQDVNVFDGFQIQEQVNFVCSDSTIIEITTKKKKYRSAEIIDGRGMTIIPPLINAHVHVRDPQNLKDGLAEGIFAMLDMFTTDRRANYLRGYNDSLRYARYYSSNIGATVPGGHGTQYGVQIPTLDSTLSGRQFVADRIAQRADYIKITQEQSMSKLSGDQIRAVTEAAKKQGLKTVGHLSALADAKDLARESISGLAHIWYRDASISNSNDLASLSGKGIFIIPTLSVIKKLIEKAEAMGSSKRYLNFESVQNEVRKVNETGIRLLAGTDSPNYGMNYTTQLYEELVLLKQCGLTNLEVLKAATTNIYEAFELKEFGILQPDGRADFILITGKPYENIEVLKGEKRVWKSGMEM